MIDPVRTHRASLLILVVGILVTAALSVGAELSYSHNQRHLSSLETSLTASALGATPTVFQHELGEVAGVVANSPNPARVFRHLLAPLLKPSGAFASAALLELKDGAPTLLLHLGMASLRNPTGTVPTTLYRKAAKSGELVTSRVVAHGEQRLGYLVASTGSQGTFIVGGAQSVAVGDRISIPSHSPDSSLDIAVYFGSRVRQSALIASSASQLPLRGAVSKAIVPFGTSELTLVATPRMSLAGTLTAVLPWVVGGAGLALTLLVALLVERIVGRRLHAEELAEENDLLYHEQRDVALTLQRALLPRAFPSIPGVEFAAAYEPGARHTEIGGDWYSVVKASHRRFYFVVGDVSGHSVEAAAHMAQVRFTIRALARLGHDPAQILELASEDLDVGTSGHFATVLVGMIDDRQALTVASAGHFPPLLLDGERAEFVEVQPGIPLGVRPASYEEVMVTLSPGETVIAFTDGLVETRAAVIDSGLARLRRAALSHSGTPPEALVNAITSELIPEGAEDDVALLVIRCSPISDEDTKDEPTGGTVSTGALGV